VAKRKFTLKPNASLDRVEPTVMLGSEAEKVYCLVDRVDAFSPPVYKEVLLQLFFLKVSCITIV